MIDSHPPPINWYCKCILFDIKRQRTNKGGGKAPFPSKTCIEINFENFPLLLEGSSNKTLREFYPSPLSSELEVDIAFKEEWLIALAVFQNRGLLNAVISNFYWRKKSLIYLTAKNSSEGCAADKISAFMVQLPQIKRIKMVTCCGIGAFISGSESPLCIFIYYLYGSKVVAHIYRF